MFIPGELTFPKYSEKGQSPQKEWIEYKIGIRMLEHINIDTIQDDSRQMRVGQGPHSRF